jgi:outer membrane biosynthesis protein TonB
MKKASIFLIIAALAVSLIACSQRDDESGIGESIPPASSFSAGEPEETTTPSEEAATESGTTQPSESEQASAVVTDKPEQSSGSKPTSTSNTESQPPAATDTKPKGKPTEPPTPSEPPAAPTPAPTDPPEPKTAYDAPYNTTVMVANARAYGESIGMTWSEALNTGNCSWEAPGATSSTLSGERLKTAIESSIRRIKKLQQDNEYQPGEFHFKVLFEPQGNGEYTIYFLMG